MVRRCMILSDLPVATSAFRVVSNPNGYDYLLSAPPARTSTRWPLILFLHGSAFRGNDPTVVGTHGLPRLLQGGDDLSAAEAARGAELARRFAIVAPQCPDFEVWDDARVLALLDDVEGEFNVDARRVYLTGLSMGGFGTWSVGVRHPERFAAIVPICGGGRIADIAAAGQPQRAALRRLGVWAFHGARDVTVPLEESERMVAALQAAGASDVRLTVYLNAEHDAWSESYANPALYTWLLEHAR